MPGSARVPVPGALGGLETYPYPSAMDLVVVCGHAVYTAGDYSRAGEESSWYLEDYQRVKGRAETFVEHAKVGVMEAANNPKALLVFSVAERLERALEVSGKGRATGRLRGPTAGLER